MARNRRPDFDPAALPPGAVVREIKLPGASPVKSPAPKVGKYRNVRTEYAGVLYDSKAEADHARELDDLKRRGLVRFWLRQPTFRLGCPENVYRPDFLVIDHLGNSWCVDVKGAETKKFRKDKRLWAKYGEMPLRIVRKGVVAETITPGGGLTI